jgi:alkane 1-monooxygenase
MEYLSFSFQWGFFCGLNAIAGHELFHRKEWWNKAIGSWAYTKFGYTHIIDEHVTGHHKDIATPEDISSAKKGQSFYSFFVMSFVCHHVATWKRAVKAIKREYGEDVSFAIILYRNKMTHYFLLHLAIVSAIYFFLGFQSVKYQLYYAFWGNFYLELINYIEHYGLTRNKGPDGIYESISPMHSWNSTSSPTMFRLQRHSDHHAHSFRPYQILRRFDDAPYLGFDYVLALVVALCPPLWFYCINPRVEAIDAVKSGNKKRNETDAFDNLSPLSQKNLNSIYAGYGYIAVL